jgi:hypothetical protein
LRGEHTPQAVILTRAAPLCDPNLVAPRRILAGLVFEEEPQVSTGAKIAIGCLVAVLAAGVVVVVVIGVGAYWAKGKIQEVGGNISARTTEIAEYEKTANANPFTRPEDGVVQEARLVKFLDVRRQVFTVYEQHKADFESMEKKKEAGFSDLMKFGGLVADIKLAQAKGLAAAGMSESEYAFMIESIYKSGLASGFEKETGKQLSQYAQDALNQAKEAARQANEAAKKAGAPGAQGVSPEDLEKMQKEINDGSSGLHSLDVPKANIELFRKYEPEIKKYAMGGLEMIGL